MREWVSLGEVVIGEIGSGGTEDTGILRELRRFLASGDWVLLGRLIGWR